MMTRRLLRVHRTAHLLVATLAFLLSAVTVHAVAPRPGLLEELRAEGRLATYLNIRRTAGQLGVCAPSDNGRMRDQLAAGVRTNYYVPCILVDFPDNPYFGGAVGSTPAMFDSLLFSSNLNPTGSFKNYYEQISYGQITVIGAVTGWHRLTQNYSFYMAASSGIGGAYPNNSRGLVEAAVAAAEAAGFDFSPFDNNGDGYVDGVMVVVPGTGAEETGNPGSIHSHKWQVVNEPVYDGVIIREYTIQPEETGAGGGRLNSIGVFCHEWGHILGLPDLYDLDQCADLEECGHLLSSGLGYWSLMALGNWLPTGPNIGKVPAHPDAWCRVRMGFAGGTNILSNTIGTQLPAVEYNPVIYRLWTNGAGGNEYFLVENRRRKGFDQYIPGQGLAIYHIDETMGSITLGNRNQWIENVSPPTPHYWVALEQADGKFSLEKDENLGDLFDMYFADSAGFDHLSYPSSRDYFGGATQVAVWGISPSDSVMTANFDVTFSRPYLETSNYVFSDPEGDGDGVIEEGETFQLVFDLFSGMLPVGATTVTVTADGSGLTAVDNTFNVGSMATGELVNTSTDPIKFTVPSGFTARVVTFDITASTSGGQFQWSDSVKISVGTPRFLVVDDDRGTTRHTWFFSAFESLGQIYGHWDVNLRGIPPLDTLLAHAVVVWLVGDSNSTHPTPEGVAVMRDYLDAHGRLFLTGQDIAENLSERADSVFLRDYLGVRFESSNLGPFWIANGVPGDPISDGHLLSLSGNGAGNQKSPDNLLLVPGAGSSVLYTWSGNGKPTACRIEDGYRAVLFAFGFEAISSNFPNAASQPQVLQRIIDWLDTDINTGVFDDIDDGAAASAVPRTFALAQNYPNPFNAGTVIPVNLRTQSPRHLRLEIFDILGRRIRTVQDRMIEPGRHEFAWDGVDDRGRPVASGVYLYRVQISGAPSQTRRMVLLR